MAGSTIPIRAVDGISPAPSHAVSGSIRMLAGEKSSSGSDDRGRILMLVTNLTFGGAEAQVVRLAGELKPRGWEVAIASLVEPETHKSELAAMGVRVHSLRMKRRIPDPRAIFRLRKLIGEFKPDVVHSHMFHANLLGRLTRIVTKIPILISTVHNLRETSERGGPTWYKEMLYRATGRLADRTTIVCQAAFDRHVRVGAMPAASLQVMPNFIDTQCFLPDDARRLKARKALGLADEFVWIAVGRLVMQKDYPTLLRAVYSLAEERTKVLLVGGGPLAGELQRMVIRLGLDSVVQFCGTSEDILDFYAAADAFVMSSRFEGLSVALLEASSMALPSVVTDAGGNSEIVKDGISGHVVPCGDANLLAKAMRQVMHLSPAERSKMGSQARQRCVTHFDREIVVQRWLNLYREARPAGSSPSKHSNISSLRRAESVNGRTR